MYTQRKDGSDKNEFTFNSEAWAMMEKKLDTRDRKVYFLWFFLGAILIAEIISSYLQYLPNNRI